MKTWTSLTNRQQLVASIEASARHLVDSSPALPKYDFLYSFAESNHDIVAGSRGKCETKVSDITSGLGDFRNGERYLGVRARAPLFEEFVEQRINGADSDRSKKACGRRRGWSWQYHCPKEISRQSSTTSRF
ncbi:MAG: hypothetical protein WCH30_01615 [Chlorobiaceae bacterium]